MAQGEGKRRVEMLQEPGCLAPCRGPCLPWPRAALVSEAGAQRLTEACGEMLG